MMNKRSFAKCLCAVALVSLSASATWAAEEITFLAYSGLFQQRYTKMVVEPFMAANPDIKINYFGLPTSGQMLGTLRAQKASPQADVTLLDIVVSKAGTDEGLFAKIDESSVPNLTELRPEARVEGVNGVAVTFDSFSVLFNPTLVKEPLKGIKDLAAPDLKGKVAFTGMPDILGLSAIMVLDKLQSGPGISGQFAKGFDAMASIAPNVLTWEPQPEVFPLIIGGQVAAGMGWNARSQYNAKMSEGKLQAVVPEEGTVFQINTINLIANAQHSAAAKRFINYALSAEAQKRFSQDMYYAPTNAKVELDQETASKTVIRQMEKVVPTDWIAVAKVRDQLLELWRRRIIPLSR
jgi:putative spermidine/putrescine transport system substrate-binding protein